MRLISTVILSLLATACGGGSSGSSSTTDPTPPPTTPPPSTSPLVSFSISDAPVDSAVSVNVTFDSITLQSNGDNNDDSGLAIPILDDDGNPTTMTLNLLDYQNGDSKLIIDGVEIDAGDYSNLILNTSGCPQNHNGSTEFCWVEDSEGIKPLKTPSNKLRLGAFSVLEEDEQAYTIEFNLRASLTQTAGGASYNLKPHGIRIVNDAAVGSLSGTVDVNLLTAGENCETDYQQGTDHGKVVYLYQGEITENDLMADEFDPEEAENPIPDNAVMPYASDLIAFDADTSIYSYAFAQLDAGEYTVAFSCSAVEDDSSEYDSILIANPSEQKHSVTIEAGVNSEINFTEN